MAMTEMRDLLKHELGDILFAEKAFLKGTKKLAKEASDPAMRERLEAHVGETEGQIRRIEEAFRTIGEKPKAETCEAAIGLLEEHDSFVKDEEPSREILEAFDLGSGLRVEHYEIAAYRSAMAVARSLGERECYDLLRQSLLEEEAMAKFIEQSAGKTLKTVAQGMGRQQQEAQEGGGGARKSAAKKSTAKKSTAKKSTAKKSTAKKSTAKKSGGRKTAAKS